MKTEKTVLYIVGGVSLLMLILEAAIVPLQGFTPFDPVAVSATGWGLWRIRPFKFSILDRLIGSLVVALIVKHTVCYLSGTSVFSYLSIPAMAAFSYLTFNFLGLNKAQSEAKYDDRVWPVWDPKDDKHPILFDDKGTLFLPSKYHKYHTQIIGGSGSGKSVFIKYTMFQLMKYGHGMFIFDPKSNYARLVSYYAQMAGRVADLRYFDMSDVERSQTYNPLYGRVPDIVYNKMILMLFPEHKRENLFYYSTAKTVISNLTTLLLKEVNTVTFQDYKQILCDEINDFKTLQYLCAKYADTPQSKYFMSNWIELAPDKRNERLAGLISRINGFCGKSWSNLINVRDPQIIVDEVVRNHRIFILGTSVLSGVEDAKALAIAAILDFGPVLAQRMKDPPDDMFYLLLDEFYNLAFADFVETINKCREANMPCILAHQSLGDLKAVSEEFCSQIMDNTANKVVLPVSSNETIDYFAKMFGTIRISIPVYSYTADGSVAGSSIRPDEQFRFNPNYLKERNPGQAVVLSRWKQPKKGDGFISRFLGLNNKTFEEKVMAFEVRIEREKEVPKSFDMGVVLPDRHLDKIETLPIKIKVEGPLTNQGATQPPPTTSRVSLHPRGKIEPSPLAKKARAAAEKEAMNRRPIEDGK